MKQVLKQKIEKRSTEIAVLIGIVIVAGAAVQAQSNILDSGNSSGLVAEYRFDTGAGDTAYDTAGDNDGVINGAEWTEGVGGKALDFDGSDDSTNIGRIPLSKSNIGISVWIDPERPKDKREIIIESSQDSRFFPGYRLALEGGQPKLDIYGVNDNALSVTGESKVTQGWQHIAATINRSSQKGEIYLNGKNITESVTGSIPQSESIDSGQNTLIGVQTDNGHFYSGKMDRLKIYRNFIDSSKARALSNSGSWSVGTEMSNENPAKVLDMSFQHQNSSHVFDTSGYSNHAKPQNGASQENAVNCKVGRCYSFDGQDDFLNTSGSDPSLDATEGVTLMAWVRPTADISGYSRLIQKGQNSAYGIYIDKGTTRPVLRIRGGNSNDYDSGTQLPKDEWTHLTATYNSSTGRGTFYYDGRIVYNSASGTGNIGTNNAPLRIGTRAQKDTAWEGMIDQVKVFNRTLSHTEIVQKTNGLSTDGVALNMRFNQDGGDFVKDNSIYYNPGRLKPNESYGPDRVQGISGNALKFEGNSDDWVDLGEPESLKDENLEPDFTITAWVRFDEIDTGSQQSIVGKGSDSNNDNIDFWENNGQIGAYLDKIGGSATFYVDGEQGRDVSADRWHFVAMKLEGIEFADADGSAWGIGRHGERTSLERLLDGTVDNLKMHPYALKDSKLKEMYERGKAKISSTSERSSLEEGLVLSQTFDRIETCGQSDTVTCPSGLSGGIVVDESGEANHGELINGPTEKSAEKCKKGGCLSFDGEDDEIYGDVNSPINYSTSTISFWTKFESLGTYNRMFSNIITDNDNGSNSGIILKDQGGCGGDAPQPTTLTEEEWQHIAVSFDESSNKTEVFYNGKKESTEDCAYTANLDNLGYYYIASNNGKNYYKGVFDEFRVYDRSLSEQEVWKLYTQGRDREDGMAGPIAKYDFKKPTGTKNYPGKSCNQIYEARDDPSSGTYWIDPDMDGNDQQKVYCDMGLRNDGWNLIYNYNHTGGNNPPATEGKWPQSHDALSHQDNLQRFGFDQQMIKEVRFRCETSNHDRIVHYVSKDSDTIQGILDNSTTIGYQSVANSSYKLPEHSANLPDAAGSDTGESEPGSALFGPGFPMYQSGSYHWSIGEPNRGGNRWECDDYPGDASQDTLHQIWIKSEGVTSIPDLSGEGNSGQINGNPQIVSGKRGKAMEFDGSDDYVDFDNSLKPERFSLSFWTYYKGGGDDVSAVLNNHNFEQGGYWTVIRSDVSLTKFRVNENGNTYDINVPFSEYDPREKWTHWVFTFDGSETRVFVNADEPSGSPKSADLDYDNTKTYLGDSDRYTGSSFKGRIDDVRIYPYALSQSQVQQVMNQGGVSVGS